MPTFGPSSAPATLATVYCTDEDILLRAYQDYAPLCPKGQVLAAGADGVFAPGSPWTLTSAAVDFKARGVPGGSVVQLTKPLANFPAGGLLLAVDAVDTGAALLRSQGKPNGVGQPPAPAAGLTGVTFSVPTFGPQIELASYDLNKLFGVDPNVGLKAPGLLYDPRELRQFTVLTVLRRAYTAATKDAAGDYAAKLALVSAELDDVRGRLELHWGNLGEAELPRHSFSMKVRR